MTVKNRFGVRTRLNRLLYGSLAIPTVSLDACAEATGRWPTVLKVDVEGYELEVFAGASEVMARRPRTALEFHGDLIDRYGHSKQAVIDQIDPVHYRTWVQLEPDAVPREAPIPDPEALGSRAHIYAIPRP